MGTYTLHYRALAERVAESGSSFLWRRDDPDDALYYFLAVRMLDAGLIAGASDGTTVRVDAVTPDGKRKLGL